MCLAGGERVKKEDPFKQFMLDVIPITASLILLVRTSDMPLQMGGVWVVQS